MNGMKYKMYCCTPCPHCVRAKSLLQSKGIEFEEEDITHNEELWTRLSQENNGWRTVPMIFVNDQFIGGFPELKKHLEEVTE